MDIDRVISLLKEAEKEIGEPETREPIFVVWSLVESARVEAEYIKERETTEEAT